METNWADDEVLAAHYVIYIAEGSWTGAQQPGGFAEALIHAIFKADPGNRARLGMGFPVLVNAVRKYKEDENGHIELKRIAGLGD